jgi:uncharacterized protein
MNFRVAIKRHPLVAYFGLTYALAWALIPLVVSVSLALALLALFAPAIAAIIVTAITEGKIGVKQLFARAFQWRIAWRWYAVALGLPFVLAGLVWWLAGAPARAAQPLSLTLILAALVIGEELGWRGFALPKLQKNFSPLISSLILGAFWAVWHLPNALIPGLGYYFSAFPLFFIYVLAMTVLFTWLANRTQGSVLIAWIFHAAINASGAFFAIGDNVRQWALSAAVYSVVAITVSILTARQTTRVLVKEAL